AALMITLALDSFYRPKRDDPGVRIMRAVELARPLGDRAVLAAALAVAALCSAFVSDFDAARTHCDEAAALVDAMTDEELAARPDAAAHLAGAEAYLERFDECIVHAARGVGVARATGQSELVPTLVPALWTGLWMKGRLVEGADLMDGALEAARLAGNR